MAVRKLVTSFAATRLLPVALATLAGMGVARAQPEPSAPPEAAPGGQPNITWDAPAGCPDRAGFAALVARYLGHSADAGGVTVEVTVTATETGFHLTWHMQSEEGFGERSLDGPDCGLLAETGALTLALAIDPSAGADEIDETAIFEPDDERPPDRLEPVEPPIEVTQPARRRPTYLGVAMRLFGGATLGALPGAAPSLGAALAARWRRWRIEGVFSWWFERRETLPGDPDEEPRGGDFTMYAGALRVCAELVGPLSVCLGGELGEFEGAGFGFGRTQQHAQRWLGATGTVAYSRKIANHLFFRADLEIGVPQTRPAFVNTTTDELVYQQPLVNGRLLTGLELQFL